MTMPKFTRNRPLVAVQNTDETRQATVAWIKDNYWADHVESRDEVSIWGTISWWIGDTGYHAAPGQWIVEDHDGTLVIWDDKEFRAEFTEVPEP